MATEYGPLLDALRGVRWLARRAVGAALPGAHRSKQRGTSGEFTEYRLYRQGDDPRQLDWKLLARSDRAFVRLTDDRALLPTWFVVDASASMAFPAERPNKWSTACAIAVGLAAVAHASGDPVGMLVAEGEGARRLAPRTRRGTVGELGRTLDDCQPRGATPLAPLLAPLSPNSRVIVISDLLGDLDDVLSWSAQFVAAGATVECVHVVAEEELVLPRGARLARDPELPAVEHVVDDAGQRDYREAFDAFRRDAARRWRASGAGYREVTTGAPVPRIVRQIVMGQG